MVFKLLTTITLGIRSLAIRHISVLVPSFQNLRLDQGEVVVKTAHGSMRSGLRKLGGLLGDAAEVGCNTVLQPGTILGPRSAVFPGLLLVATLVQVKASGSDT